MAASIRSCLGVDIGSQWIRVADMEMGKNGPRVLSLLERRLELDPSLNEAQRNQQIARQLQELLKSGKVHSKRAVFSVPGQTVFVRQFPVPKSTPERMRRIVNFEARQRVPFPLDKTIMEYQVFEGEQSGEVNVLLVAIKRDFIINFMRLVRRTGLKLQAISVSSIALYNFHELNSSQRELDPAAAKKREKEDAKAAAKKKTKAGKKNKKARNAPEEETPEELEGVDVTEGFDDEGGFEEIQAYVNLGASLMDLAIPKPGRARMIGFTRSVPLAGNEMDRVVKDKLGLESAEQARQIKERDAVVLSTDFEIDGDPDKVSMPASEAATGIADRIIQELRRSLDYYISQPDGVAVDSIVLSGGLSKMRFLASYIEEKMGVPVSLTEPQNPKLHMPANVPDPFCAFAQAVGLGLQGLGIGQNQINFLPEEVKNLQGLQRRKGEVAAMALMLLVIVGMSWNVGASRIDAYQSATRQLNATIQERQTQSQQLKEIIAKNQQVTEAYKQLAEAAGPQDYWLDFLRNFIEHRPPEILIDSIECRLDGNVLIKGRTPDQTAIKKFVDQLRVMTKGEIPQSQTNPDGNMPVQIDNFNQQPVRDPRFNQLVTPFEITVKTWVQIGRMRPLGQDPTTPAPTPTPANARGGAVAPTYGGFRPGAF